MNSHLMWMGSDPIQNVRALDGAIYHVHAKDTRLQTDRQALTSRLETLPWERVDDRAWNYVTLATATPAAPGSGRSSSPRSAHPATPAR